MDIKGIGQPLQHPFRVLRFGDHHHLDLGEFRGIIDGKGLFYEYVQEISDEEIYHHEETHDKAGKDLGPLQEINEYHDLDEFPEIASLHEIPVPVHEEGIDGGEHKKTQADRKVDALISHVPEIAEPYVCSKEERQHYGQQIRYQKPVNLHNPVFPAHGMIILCIKRLYQIIPDNTNRLFERRSAFQPVKA